MKIVMFSGCLKIRRSNKRGSDINKLNLYSYNFFTAFQQKMWKIGSLAALLMVVLCLLLTVTACSGARAKGAQKSGPVGQDENLISKNQDEVRKRFGEPTAVSKTLDDHIFWVYRPSWKIMPNYKGTLYVEFENEKVIKVFRTK
jgi:hypothetical protein